MPLEGEEDIDAERTVFLSRLRKALTGLHADQHRVFTNPDQWHFRDAEIQYQLSRIDGIMRSKDTASPTVAGSFFNKMREKMLRKNTRDLHHLANAITYFRVGAPLGCFRRYKLTRGKDAEIKRHREDGEEWVHPTMDPLYPNAWDDSDGSDLRRVSITLLLS